MVDQPIGAQDTVEPIGAQDSQPTVNDNNYGYEREKSMTAYLLTRRDDATFVEGMQKLTQVGLERLTEEAQFGADVADERAQRRATDFQEKLSDVYNNPDLAYNYVVAAADPEVDLNDFRYNINTEIGLEVISRLQQQEGTGATDAVLDFGSFILRDSTFGIGYNVTMGSESAGAELAQRRLTMKPSEFKAWFEGYAQEVMSQGLRDGNTWNIDQLMNELTNNGYDPNAGINAAFGLLDLGGLVTGGLKLAKAGTRAASTIGRTAILSTADDAAEVAVQQLLKQVDEEVLTDVGPSILNHHKNDVSISQSIYSRILGENSIVRKVQELTEAGTFGKVIDPETAKAATADIRAAAAKEFKATTGYRVYDTVLSTDNLGNYSINLQVGNYRGEAFKYTKNGEVPKNLQERADSLGGTVVPVDPQNLKSGFVINVRQNLGTNKLIDDITINELDQVNTNLVAKLVNNQYTSSATARGVEALDVAAKRGEAGASLLQSVFKQEARKITKLNAVDRARLNIVTELRDGKNATRKEWYSAEEFKQDYRARFNEEPSQKIVDAYNATVTISDAAWLLKTNQVFRKYIANGYKGIDVGGITAPARAVDGSVIKTTDRVFDAKFGGDVLKSDLRGGAKVRYWKLDKPMDNGVQYVADPKMVKELEPWNVMGYNAGGPRINPRARYFVVAGVGERMKTLLTAVTEKQARLAEKQLDEINRNIDNLTDDLIQKNNDWNPEIQTVKQFEEFAAENGWKFDGTAKIGSKQRDGVVLETVDDAGDIMSKMNMEEYVLADMRRGNKVLPDFGGGSAYNVDSVTAVQQQFSTVANEYAFNVATHKAIVGWVETAKKISTISFPSNIADTDYRNLFLRAEINGTDSVSNRMREIRGIEMRRMNIKSEASLGLQRLGERIAEYVFDLGEGSFAKRVLQSETVEGLIKDPSAALLKLNFTSAFGFFNISQMLVQSVHAVSIMAISKQGLKGASMALQMRGLVHAAPEVVEEGLRRAAKHYGYSEAKMREIFDYVRTSGRDVIEGDAVELGTGAAYGISGWGGDSYKLSAIDKAMYNTTKFGRAAMDKGLMFYRGGERAARMTGIYTATAEYIAKYPERKLLSEHARNWIAKREADLNLNMTTTSRGYAQSGVMRVPTQWLSYNLRAMEAVFVGRGFTKMERAKLAASLTLMYGLSGFGAERAAEEIAGMFGWGEDSAAFTALKWGVIDGIMDALLPDTEGKVGTGLAKRLSVVQGIKDTYNKITGGQFLEVVGGPSYSIAGNLMGSVVGTVGSMVSGDPVLMTEDLLQLIRQPSGIDNVAKALGIFNNGMYTSKTGTAIPSQMTVSEGIMALFGVNSLKATEWYDAQTKAFADSSKLREYRSWVNNRSEIAWRYINEGNIERGIALLGELRAHIATSGFSPEQQASLGRSAMTQDENGFDRLIDQVMTYDRAAAQRIIAVQR